MIARGDESPAMSYPPSNFSVPAKNGLSKLSGFRGAKPNGVKKLVIKNAKSFTLPDHFYSNTWNKLDEAVSAIHEERPTRYNLEDLYGSVEDICTHKLSHQLYDDLRSLCEKRIRFAAENFIRNSLGYQSFLKDLNAFWADHCRQSIMIRCIFLVLDRTYLLPTHATLSLWDMSLDLFLKNVLDDPSVLSKVVDGILVLINRERAGELVDNQLIKNLLRMLSDLQIYDKVFEQKFLHETEVMYTTESAQLMQELEVSAYLHRVARRLDEEESRASLYLDHSTRRLLILVVEKRLIAAHVSGILSRGLNGLLADGRIADLELLYNLLQRAKALNNLKNSFIEYIKFTGSNIVMDTENDEHMVLELLNLKDKLDDIVVRCFHRNEAYFTAVKDSFEYFINKRPNKPAEMIAKFLDTKLKSGNKECSEEELETIMDKVMVLFRFMSGKDVFEAFYKKDLAKRLLLGRSASVDAEKSMLSKLKQECGAQFTSKLEGMFKDIEVSKDIMVAFKTHLDLKDLPGAIEMTVNILTVGFWPTYPPLTVNIPSDMSPYLECFKNFYLSKHHGRRIQWQSTLGHCILKAKFETGAKELQVSLFQALVLLLFNVQQVYTFGQLLELTNIDSAELTRTLQSLSVGKKDSRVLRKEPLGKNVNASDTFSVNSEFQNKHFRIKINQIQLRETAQEQIATQEQIFQDRQYQIDAAVVRIMKMRKSLSHNALFDELMRQLKFPVKGSDVKKRIESLIDREYMKRDKDHNNYVYMA